MKIQHLILTAIMATGISTGVYAEENSEGNDAPANMPMMQGPQGQVPMGYYQGQPMNPMMMQRRMRMHQQNMPMDRMMQHRQQMRDSATQDTDTTQAHNCPMHHKGGKRMEMMQKKQEMMQAHMKKIESHLANIETLLKKIVENQ